MTQTHHAGGGNHNLFDAALLQADVERREAGSNREPEGMPCGNGVPHVPKKLVPIDDLRRQEGRVAAHGGPLAAMLITLIQGNCCGILTRGQPVRLARAMVHSTTGHPSTSGLFFAAKPPDNDWARKTCDNQMPSCLQDLGVIVEPDSCAPWCMSGASGLEASRLADTLRAVERAVDLALEHPKAAE